MIHRQTVLGKPRCALAYGILLAFYLLLGAGTGPAAANGWEHATIPFDALLKALEFEEAATRTRAAQSLGFRGQKEAFEPLLRRLRRPEEDPGVRSAIYTAFGALKDRSAVPALVGCLETEQRQELRGDCVAALAEIADPQVVPRLLRAMSDDSSILVRSRAVDALGRFSTPDAVSALAALLRRDANRSLRQRAIHALGRTGHATAVAPLLAALSKARSDKERSAIVVSLGRLGSSDATAPLTQLLRKTEEPRLRAQIVVALGAIRDGSASATLVQILSDPVPAVRYFAVTALMDLGRPEAVGPINELVLEISDSLDGRTDAELLENLTETELGLHLQVAALRAITGLDANAGLPALLRSARPRPLPRDSALALMVAQSIYERRRVALYGLGYTGSPEAVALLSGPAGLADPDFRLRAVAVRSLGVAGGADTAPLVLDRLEDESAEVRWTAASVLGRLGDARAVKPLIERLSDPTAEVRKQAALSLGYLGDHRAAGALRRLAVMEDNASVREAAAYATGLLEPDD